MKIKAEDLVLWSDEALLVVSKPARLPTLPDGYDPHAPYLKGILELAFDPLWTVHRLDRDTSGVLVLARSAQAHRALNAQFEQRKVTKTYHALAKGNPNWEMRTVKLPLRADGDRKHRTLIDPRRGKPSHTELQVLERFRDYVLVEAIPYTGRTHQIRAHLAALGHPIAVDGLYGRGEAIFLSQIKPGFQGGRSDETPLLERLGLHAWSLAFEHPTSGEPLRFEVPYPKDFAAVLRQLRKFR